MATISTKGIAFNDGSSMNTAPCISKSDNMVVNGDFLVSQITGAGGLSVTANTSTYVVDMWQLHCSGVSPTTNIYTQQGLNVDNGNSFISFMYIQATTPNTYSIPGQYVVFLNHIEGNNANRLAYGSVNCRDAILSFEAESDFPGDYAVVLRTAAAPWTTVVLKYNIPVANEYIRINLKVPGCNVGTWPTGINASLDLIFDLGSGSTYTTANSNVGIWQDNINLFAADGVNKISDLGGYLALRGVDLYEGSLPREFPHLNVDESVRRCQRYWEQSYPFGVAPGSVNGFNYVRERGSGFTASAHTHSTTVNYKAQKRTTPIIKIYSPVTGAVNVVRDIFSAADSATVSTYGFWDNFGCSWSTVSTTLTSFDAYFHWTSDARF